MEIHGIGHEPPAATGVRELDERDQKRVEELRRRDREVRAHEQAHRAAAGGLSRGGPSYDYERGPDGKLYAVSGEVSIDTSKVDGDPRATIRKMQQVRRAARAPANPSAKDRQIAAEAARTEREARTEAAAESREAVSTEAAAESRERASTEAAAESRVDAGGQAAPSPYDTFASPELRGSLLDLRL